MKNELRMMALAFLVIVLILLGGHNRSIAAETGTIETMKPSIRPVASKDEPRWRELFDAYTRFYEREPDEAVTRHTWQRMLDPASSVAGIVAEVDGRIVGIGNYLVHENTATLTPVCYLQDLFVDPATRAHGVGKALIDWLVAEMHAQGWSRLYWATKENNYRARGLYDKFTPHSGFLRYVVTNPRPSGAG